MNERVNEIISRSILTQGELAMDFDKIMRNGNGCTKVVMYILPSKQEREIPFEATRTCGLVET